MERLAFRLDEEPKRRWWPIVGDVYLPTSGDGQVPVVAIAHGFGAHRNSGLVPALAEAIARSGLAAVTFDFSGAGWSTDGARIAEESRFAANTFAREIEDEERVVTAVFERMVPGRERFDIYRLGLAGIDSGGGVALIEAARDTRVKAVAALEAAPRLEMHLPPEAVSEGAARHGFLYREPASGRAHRVGSEMARDLLARRAAPEPPGRPPEDVLPAARALGAPLLVVHAEGDALVSLEDARTIFFAAGDQRAEMRVVAGAGRPLAPAGGGAAVEVTVEFFKTRL